MTRPTFAGALLALGLLAAPLAPASAQLSATDAAFVNEAASHGQGEVEMSRLAAQRASSAAVRQLAQQMIADHTAVNQSLMGLAQQRGLPVPLTVDAAHQGTIARLAALGAGDFDRLYVQQLTDDHAKDIATFEREASTGQDPALRSWAAAQIPTLRNHLQMAQTAAVPYAAVPPAAPSASPSTMIVTPPAGSTVVVPPNSSTVVVRPQQPATAAVVPVTPWCGGAWGIGGSNFGSCPR